MRIHSYFFLLVAPAAFANLAADHWDDGKLTTNRQPHDAASNRLNRTKPPDGKANVPRADQISTIHSDQPISVQKQIYPFLKRYCVACHNDVVPKAETSFTKDQDVGSIQMDSEVWRDILRHLEANTMPPRMERQPTPTEVKAFIRLSRTLLDAPRME